MRVIIYAAGVSNRLNSIAKNGLKGLIKLNGQRIIEHQLDWIVNQDVSEIIIVIGLEHELYREIIGDSYKGKSVIYIYNPDYRSKGNMLSLWCAREFCDTDTLFTTSDLICDYEDIAEFNNNKSPNKILIDSRSKELFDDSDPVKVTINNNAITNIQKNTDELESVDGLAIGLYKFSKDGIKNIITSIENKINSGNDNLSLYYAIDNVLKMFDVKPIYAKNCRWIDIDTPKDLEIAKKFFQKG
jgi:choline kinase